MKAVIMAGGKGSRLLPVTGDSIPKPLVELNGKSILEWQIEILKSQDIDEVILIVGYLHEKIQQAIGDGSRLGIPIQYIIEQSPLGTAGGLYYLKDKIKEDFFLIFGDLLFDIDFGRFMDFHKGNHAFCSLLVHPNSHPYDSDLVILNKKQKVIRIEQKNQKRLGSYRNLVNAGIYCISEQLLDGIKTGDKADLEKDIIIPGIHMGKRVFGYHTPEYVKDIGTPKRLKEAWKDLKSGLPAKRNLGNKQKCIFLDRDGTLIKYRELLSKPEQVEIEPGAVKALQVFHQAGYLVIIITNQPVVARNICSIEQLEDIHKRLETLLGKEHVYIDGIKYCPHHPDKGFPEENPAYKISCGCRKPKTGLIDECVREFHIELSQSYMIGDTTVDIQTGKNAGLKTVLVKTGLSGKDEKYDVSPDVVADSLLEAAKFILKQIPADSETRWD